MDKDVRICIVGAGAIGAVVAGVLTREGFNVQLVTKYEALAKKITDSGIIISGKLGNFTIPVPSVATPDELEGVFDYVLIATKAEGLVGAAKEILPFLNDNSRVVSMQNGICEEMLAEVVGEKRTIGCVVGWGATMHEPGKVEMTSGGEFILGNWNRGSDEPLEKLADIMGHLIKTRISNEILSELYSKLIINSCTGTLGVVCGLFLGEMLANRNARNLAVEVIREAINVAGAMGLRVAPGAAGKLDYYKFLDHGFLSGTRRYLAIRVIGLKYRRLKSSGLQSLGRGLKTEVDYYNAYIVGKGKEYNIATPVNDQLTSMVKEIEQGKRKIGLHNFKEIKQ